MCYCFGVRDWACVTGKLLDLSSCTSHLPCHVSVHDLLTDLSGSGSGGGDIDGGGGGGVDVNGCGAGGSYGGGGGGAVVVAVVVTAFVRRQL